MAQKTSTEDSDSGTEKKATEKGRKPPVLEPRNPDSRPRRPQRPGNNRTTPNGSSTLLHQSRKTNYAPAVSSPLKTDGNNSEENLSSGTSDSKPLEPRAMKSARLAPRRSLHIKVVDTPRILPRRLDEKAGGHPGYDGQSQSSSDASRNISPEVSLQSIGRDFSRYSSRQTSESLIGSSAPAPRIPLAFLYNETSTSLGRAFDTADPERGFSPYFKQQSTPVVYPTIDEQEDDDGLHNPDAYEDVTPSLRECCSHCSIRFLLTFACFIMLMLGPAILFIVWPILAYSRVRGRGDGESEPSSYPILGAIRTSLIDPDTPDYAKTRDSVLGQGKLKLVFSDEFNKDGRTFYENDDQFWQAADFHYAATNDLEWYDPDAITTQNGTLQIHLNAIKDHNLDYRSGMLQSWNKMCFKGGVMEVSASLAGPAGVSGLWPGIWTLGNLARPGNRATTDGVWPYSYDSCDVGITPNQSSTDGISYLPGQKLAKCVCRGEDHPTPGKGRGAPEIDALEATSEYNMRVGVVTQSNQVAPFDVWYQVDSRFVSIRDYRITQMNSWAGGPYQQAISGVTMLNNSWYDGKEFQKYAFEYIPGGEDGAIAWFVGDDETFRMSGKAIGPNGNVGQRDVSQEPMSIILNLGISTSWAWIDWAKLGPRLAEGTTMYIDYVRIYQKEGEESITCDPPGYDTTEYINKHPLAYNNFNFTTWDDTGYPWPRNRLMHDCDS